jgi:hypothetical protein
MKYAIIVSGRNLRIRRRRWWTFGLLSSAPDTIDFVTTRYVTASTQEDACRTAIALVHEELRSSKAFMIVDSVSLPIVEISEIHELDESAPDRGTGRGFIFYRDPKS